MGTALLNHYINTSGGSPYEHFIDNDVLTVTANIDKTPALRGDTYYTDELLNYAMIVIDTTILATLGPVTVSTYPTSSGGNVFSVKPYLGVISTDTYWSRGLTLNIAGFTNVVIGNTYNIKWRHVMCAILHKRTWGPTTNVGSPPTTGDMLTSYWVVYGESLSDFRSTINPLRAMVSRTNTTQDKETYTVTTNAYGLRF